MHLVFVRHGPKVIAEGIADDELPLAESAGELAQKLRAALEQRRLVPRFILSSRYRHALETAELLRGKRTRAVIPVTALTPHTREEDFSMATIVTEAWATGVDLFDQCDVIMLVGHETRLSQLAHRMMQQPMISQLAPLEALVVELGAAEPWRFRE